MAKQLSELRKMQRHQLNKVNKDELIESILAAGQEVEGLPSIMNKIDEVIKEMDSLKALVISPQSVINKKIASLESKVEKQSEIIVKQQLFLEALDRKEREANLVVLGVPDYEEDFDGASSDESKLSKIWTKIGVGDVITTHRRLGQRNTQRSRPILVTLQDKNERENILDRAKHLKTSGELSKKIYVKKDIHPSVRKEWERLRSVEKTEKERPENVGCVVRLDTRERKVYRDNIVIDSWNPQGF